MPDVVDLLLAQHERVREQFIHLLAATGQQKVELFAGLVEKRAADPAVAELIALGVDHPAFDGKLADLHAAVLAHAAHEEEQEFPALRETIPAAQLVALASQVRANQTEVG